MPYLGEVKTIQPGAKERIAEKMKKLEEINRERPCSECIWHNSKSIYTTCNASVGSCNFNHDNFKRRSEK